ncbi:MAG: hypothetical protein LBP65_01400 [Puniceicoccales bacterium]|jgi:hypothetical protein|nr:hypothetical protein [Puniceicoccales bacterium]
MADRTAEIGRGSGAKKRGTARSCRPSDRTKSRKFADSQTVGGAAGTTTQAATFFSTAARAATILAFLLGLCLTVVSLRDSFSRDCREVTARQERALGELRREVLDLHERLALLDVKVSTADRWERPNGRRGGRP